MTSSHSPAMGSLMLNAALDAEVLYKELLRYVQQTITPLTQLVGVTSGGAWLVERLQRDLNRSLPSGTISSSMHRDDFSQRGISSGGQTVLPFDVTNSDILLFDDVLYTGRTIRAVVNEMFDYGRPQRVQLAVLVDRGGRELPIHAEFAAARLVLPANQSLALARNDTGNFSFELKTKAAPAA